MTHDIDAFGSTNALSINSNDSYETKDYSSMKTNPRGRFRLVLSALAAGVMLLATGVTGTAMASEANIDPDAQGSLTIHKYEQPDGSFVDHPEQNSGHEITVPAGAVPLQGVEFSITPVTSIDGDSLDLTTYEGWQAADGLTAEDILDPANAAVLGTSITAETNAAGEISFTGLPVGLYLVQEGADNGDNGIIRAADPFVVAIPQPATGVPGDGTWNYDVHVYPKNSVGEIEKAVDDSEAFVLGDEVTWTVTALVPTLAVGETFSNFDISDVLDSRLGYKNLTVELVDGATTTPLTAGTHYALTAPAADTSGTVTVQFSAAGLTLLDAAASGAEVVLTLTTEVNAIDGIDPEVDGVIVNEALLNVNEVVFESDPVKTEWGALEIIKHAGQDKSELLAGAVFTVYADEALTQEVGELTTDDAGSATLPGLKAGDYWLVETQAPAGYVLPDPTQPANAIPVTIEAGGTTSAQIVWVSNNQRPPYSLPLTGAFGTALFTAFGLGLLALTLGACLVVRNRHRRDTARS